MERKVFNSSILKLVDQFIGDVLAGNLYNNTKTFLDTPRNLPPTPIEGKIDKNFTEAYRLGNLYDDKSPNLISSRGGQFRETGFVGPLRYVDVFAISHWFRSIGKEFGLFPTQNNLTNKVERSTENITKGITWLASQFLLASFNKGDPQAYGLANQIWNPLSLPTSLLPGMRGLSLGGITPTGITIGAATGLGNYQTNVQTSVATGTERLLLMRQGLYSEVAPVHRLSQLKSPIAVPGFIGDIAKVGNGDTLEQEKLPGIGGTTISAQVDGGTLTILASKMGLHTNPYNSEHPYSPINAIKPLKDLEKSKTPQLDKLSTLFYPQRFPGGGRTGEFNSLAYSFINKSSPFVDAVSAVESDSPGLNAAITDAFFTTDNGKDDEKGVFETNPIPDDQIYMPFMFQDLRDKTPEQFLYFRAFLKGDLTETFTPDWQTEKYYGRVDDIPIYMGTSRIVNVSFDVVAWQPSDLSVIYKKLHKLQSLVYPSYNTIGFLQSGPIIKMRIGDLFAGSNNRGLPGYITSLDFAYDDGIWNIQQDLKVPRKISVSLSYTVLHEGNPGSYPYSSAKINSDGTMDNDSTTGTTTFGAGKFSRNQDGSFTATVSVREIRKIFGQVRGV